MRRYAYASICFLLLIVSPIQEVVFAQDEPGQFQREDLLAAAREIMEAAQTCSLVTLDLSGSPQVRTMDPFLPDDDAMVVRFGTNRISRKVAHIRNDARVAIHYLAPSGAGYVAITGLARILDDAEAKATYWKAAWEPFYENKEADYIVIEVRPESLEILDYSKGIAGDLETLAVPTVQFAGDR